MKFACFLVVCLVSAVCFAQLPPACTPNACGPVQAMPPPPHFQPVPHFEPPHDFHGGGDFHGGDFHGGGFHGGDWHGDYAPGPHYDVNPWNFVAPIIANFATAPRYVTTPATGQMELRAPGQWVQPAPGQWAWNALPVWPLSKAATKAEKPKPERLRPLHRLVIHLL